MNTRYIYDAVMFYQEAPLNLVKDFISIRLDRELKAELTQAAELEHRSLSSFCRLLLEFAWGQYLKAGSLHGLLVPQSHHAKRSVG
jgi:hypothetical protein